MQSNEMNPGPCFPTITEAEFSEFQRLRAVNAELVGACKSALRALSDNLQPGPMDADAIAGLRATLAKATQS